MTHTTEAPALSASTLAADTGADTSADTSADTGADTSADTSADTGADTSADTGADTGPDGGPTPGPTSRTLTVPFAGEGSGTAPLTWGQAENWATIQRMGHWYPLGGVKGLPEGTTVEEVAEELAYLLGRYQVLRTTLDLTDPLDPRQVVVDRGEISLEVVEAGGAPADEVAAAVEERYRTAPVDFTRDWPIRMGVVCRDGRPTHMVVLMSHIAIDGTGAIIMMTEAAIRESAPVRGMQPLEQAAWQTSPAGRRQNEAAMRQWEHVLSTIDPVRYPGHPVPESPRYRIGEVESPALLGAVRAIGARTGRGSSTVLLALFAVALQRRTGIDPVVVRPIVGNRFRPGLGRVVCTLAQAGVCVLEVADAPMDVVLRRVQQAIVIGNKLAYFDDRDLVGLRSRIFAERGTAVDTSCFFNDRRNAEALALAGPLAATPGELAALPAGRFEWVAGADEGDYEGFFGQFDEAPGALRMTLTADTLRVSSAETEEIAADIVATALRWAVE